MDYYWTDANINIAAGARVAAETEPGLQEEEQDLTRIPLRP